MATAVQAYNLRLVRPGRSDNNPLHRDVWLPDYVKQLQAGLETWYAKRLAAGGLPVAADFPVAGYHKSR